jgi:integrase
MHRRMFTTEAVTGGLPVHIAAKVLGHRNITTTEAYLAVFQDEMISAYRAYLGKRRALRLYTASVTIPLAFAVTA